MGVSQQTPTSEARSGLSSPNDSLTVVVFLPVLSEREGRNPTIIMAAQSTTRPSNPPTPKRVAKSASQSLNHLLNFSLPPRQTQQVQSLPRRSRRHGTTQGVWNKEREAYLPTQAEPAMTTIISPLQALLTHSAGS